jgi:hypothetical protein
MTYREYLVFPVGLRMEEVHVKEKSDKWLVTTKELLFTPNSNITNQQAFMISNYC